MGTIGKARAVRRLLGIIGWTLLMLVPVLSGNALVWGHERWGGLPFSYSWRDRSVSWWARGLIFLAGVRIRVRGAVPTPPFFLVSNHLSYVDVFVLQGLTPTAFVAKAEVRSWPVLGFLAIIGGTLFIDREARRDVLRINRLLEDALDRGAGIAIFPEATTTAGDRVLPFKASLLAPIAASTQPVQVATIHYDTPEGAPPASDAVCWWGDMAFAPHGWGLLQLPRVQATVTFQKAPNATDDRKMLAQTLEASVREAFVPVDAPVPS